MFLSFLQGGCKSVHQAMNCKPYLAGLTAGMTSFFLLLIQLVTSWGRSFVGKFYLSSKTVSFVVLRMKIDKCKTYPSWRATFLELDEFRYEILPGCVRCNPMQVLDHQKKPRWQIFIIGRFLSDGRCIIHGHVTIRSLSIWLVINRKIDVGRLDVSDGGCRLHSVRSIVGGCRIDSIFGRGGHDIVDSNRCGGQGNFNGGR